MANLDNLIQQREALDKQIMEMRQREKQSAIENVRGLIARHELTQEDVFPSRSSTRATGKSSTAGTKVAPKYRDTATGKTWTGRGKPPVWIAGKDRQQYLIK